MVTIALFIDGANTFATTQNLGFSVDWKKLLEKISKEGYVLQANYYTARDDSQGYSEIGGMILWLDRNGYNVNQKAVEFYEDEAGVRTRKGNMDIEIAVDAMAMADKIQVAYLFSGDGDFTYLVKALRQRGVKVIVVSSRETKPHPYVKENLRNSANLFIDIAGWRDEISRAPLSPLEKLARARRRERMKQKT